LLQKGSTRRFNHKTKKQIQVVDQQLHFLRRLLQDEFFRLDKLQDHAVPKLPTLWQNHCHQTRPAQKESR
jgi:hypothetical protein